MLTQCIQVQSTGVLFHVFSLSFCRNRGGVLLTVHGENLDAVETATLLVNVVKNESPGVIEEQLRSVSTNIISYKMV